MAGYILGLPYGPKGVALAYSSVMTLWVIPHIAWCVKGTVISLGDILRVVGRPLISGIVAAAVAFGVQFVFGPSLSPLPRLVLGMGVLLVVYALMLLYVMGQKAVYLSLIQGFKKRAPVGEDALASV